MVHSSRFLKHAVLMAGLGLLSLGVASPVLASDRLVIAEAKGDRGLPAPYAHQKAGPAYIYTSYIFDTLLGQDKTGAPAPALASSWTVSDDGLSYDLMLNPKAQWHDGKPVTAEDVAFTFSYMKEHPYNFVSVANVEKIESLAADHVRLTLKERDAGMITSKLISLPILPRHIYEKVAIPERFTGKQATIGSGPYKLVSYDKAQGRYLYERNETYYLGQPKYKQLAAIRMTPSTAIEAIANGQVDLYNSFPMEQLGAARKAGLSVMTYLSNHPVKLLFNHQGKFKQTEMRQALAYAIDRQRLVDVAYPGKGEVAETGFFQRESPWHKDQDDPDYKYDKEKASQLFMEQGWIFDDGVWSQNGDPVVLQLVTNKSFKKLATVLAEQLTDFGIKTETRVMEDAAMHAAFRDGAFDIALETASTMGDPDSVIFRIFSKSPKSDKYFVNGRMKKLLIDQAAASSVGERAAMMHEFQALYARELPAYMLVNPLWAVVHSANVEPLYMKTGISFGIPMAIPKRILMP
ncbi:ABC transporter substrate-binding protein [uncultured Cohaesibacter sp.]|uniref:ABC transporter substrate-binding protein n=1 Tax=uncultured Cohaesibacter sp. TaxID=1002546 RepID=UPI00292CC75E|nr:ABC transporter substrate-binding protein [uncultured Cohaesibacter sp.]